MDLFSLSRNSKMEIGEVYYWTSTIYKWKHLLKFDKYKQVIVDSLLNLHQRKKVRVYRFVVMPNHLHLLWEMLEMNGKEMPHASFQKFTAQTIQKDLKAFHLQVLAHFLVEEKERDHRYWQRDPLAVKVFNRAMAEQKLGYMHSNPLQEHWNLVKYPEDYYYSSARYYEDRSNSFGFLTHYLDRF